MPFYAYHQTTGMKYHIDDWLRFFPEEFPVCDLCKNILKIRAKSSVGNVAAHFYHESNTNCPSIESNRKRYEGLRPTERDEYNAHLMKELTSQHLDKVYLRCKHLLNNNLSYSQYKEMLIAANKSDIWYYKGLIFKYVPYVLLVNYGVFKEQGKFFVFESNLNNYDDLWNHQKSIKNRIWRVDTTSNDVEEFTMIDDLILKDYFFKYRDLLK
ncbi:hypothetical protein JDW19_00755 [Paenibacillus polymyxa]|uniref:Uncharacterized protein n=1 Tax=Paenibacillus polymyxa TaxID=1406 RepID=A0A8I1IX41_PAEPO|nr:MULTISPECIES: hypothetical protein [unclassified Paenibacillus]KAF6576868.1 hypothetical protein G9G53_02920 [Paenibacillus sp. EKM206P]MBM0631669.1 hypothetical protein [Paenibacillus polymyxa]